MSSIAERASLEADEAERENPDAPEVEVDVAPEVEVAPDETTEDGSQNASESPSGLSLKEVEARFGKTEKAGVTYSKKVLDTLGELAESLSPCPLCPDVHKGFIDLNDAGRIPDELVAVVQAFLGVQREADYNASPTTHTCDACGGLGKVKSGSRVPNYVTLTCSPCQGTGFVPPPGGSSPGLAVVPGGASTPDGEQFTAPATDSDPWGSPRLLENGVENPNYGKMPQFKDPNLP